MIRVSPSELARARGESPEVVAAASKTEARSLFAQKQWLRGGAMEMALMGVFAGRGGVKPGQAAAASEVASRPWMPLESDDVTVRRERGIQRADEALRMGKGLRVCCVTWNMNEKLPRADDDVGDLFSTHPSGLSGVLAGRKGDGGGPPLPESELAYFDLIAVCVQEGPVNQEKWERRVQASLGGESRYALLASSGLGGIYLSVFCRAGDEDKFSEVETDTVACGVGNVMHNKGAAGVRLMTGNERYLFVSSHFAAHQHKVDERNADFVRICTELFAYHSADGTGPVGCAMSGCVSGRASNRVAQDPEYRVTRGAEQHESALVQTVDAAVTFAPYASVVWGGDLNYRVNGNRGVVECLAGRQDYEALLANDQLLRQMRRRAAFSGFREGSIRFPPTYKFDCGTDTYDTSKKARVPSYTDRVLWWDKAGKAARPPQKSVGSKFACTSPDEYRTHLLSYHCVPSLRSSDHRPVVCHLLLNAATDHHHALTTSEA